MKLKKNQRISNLIPHQKIQITQNEMIIYFKFVMAWFNNYLPEVYRKESWFYQKKWRKNPEQLAQDYLRVIGLKKNGK